ncbi:MAG: hypothetical protein R3D30_08925 [Hyphomicrobiales bacterium]
MSIIENGGVVAINGDHNTLGNTGVLWSTGATAVLVTMASSAATITNSANGYVRGDNSAIGLLGSGVTVFNSGQMFGGQNGIGIFGANSEVNNDPGGTIKGGNLGIKLDGGSNSQINNAGFIYGGNAGVTMFSGTLVNDGDVGGELAESVRFRHHRQWRLRGHLVFRQRYRGLDRQDGDHEPIGRFDRWTRYCDQDRRNGHDLSR